MIRSGLLAGVAGLGIADDVVTQPIPTARGHVDSLDRPGLGVDVDEDAVRRYRVTIAARNVA